MAAARPPGRAPVALVAGVGPLWRAALEPAVGLPGREAWAPAAAAARIPDGSPEALR